MKNSIWAFIKVGLILVSLEMALFLVMIFFLMADEPVGIIGKSICAAVKYVLGFPLVLINDDYPFFLNSSKPPAIMFPLLILNLIMQTSAVLLLKRVFKG